MTWQPIESAPKDGTPILGLCWDGFIATVSWVSLTPTGEGCWALDLNADANYSPHPTHWMPRPPDP